MEFESSLKKKRSQEKTVEHPKQYSIHVVSGADDSTISAFIEQFWKVSYILTFTPSSIN